MDLKLELAQRNIIIANGIALGFISYAGVKLLAGRFTEANPSLLVLAALFIVKYAFF